MVDQIGPRERSRRFESSACEQRESQAEPSSTIAKHLGKDGYERLCCSGSNWRLSLFFDVQQKTEARPYAHNQTDDDPVPSETSGQKQRHA